MTLFTLVVSTGCSTARVTKDIAQTQELKPDSDAPEQIHANVIQEQKDPVLSGVDAELIEEVDDIKHGTLTPETNSQDEVDQLLDQTESEQDEAEKKVSVELLWRIPEQPVEHYVLTYGPEPEQLFHRVVIPLLKLETKTHTQFGNVYRYVLHGIPLDSSLYFTLQAGNEKGLSPEAPVQKIQVR